jgi:exonuclease VII large subunit
MSKQSKSQWDFGEMFPPSPGRSVGAVWVGGEVSNLRAQSSGHIYFTLKDAGAQLSCVCFRAAARESRALLADGQQVILQGDVTVYEVRGQYRLKLNTRKKGMKIWRCQLDFFGTFL